MFKVQATCPTRIDLAGGTLDLWPLYHQLSRKATVNLAIDLCVSVEVSRSSSPKFSFESLDQNISLEGSFSTLCEDKSLPLLSLFLKTLWKDSFPPISIQTRARSPKGAGLGGSSSLAIALCSAILKAKEICGEQPKKQYSEESLVSLCQDVESAIIKAPTGYQDYWAAVRGGVNLITYPFGSLHVETLASQFTQSFNDYLLVVYSGQSRASALNNWSVYQSFFSGDSNTVRFLEKIGAVAESCLEAFKENNLEKILELSKKEWGFRREMWPDIVTEYTEKVDRFACDHGALFTRVCGAGGGGVVSIFVEPQKREKLRDELKKSHFEILDTKITTEGLRVVTS